MRLFEVCFSWSSYVSRAFVAREALHRRTLLVPFLPRSLTRLYPDPDQPELAPFHGLHAKYSQDNVNETVMFFLTTVQQQLEKSPD